MNKNLIKKIILIAPLSMLMSASYAEEFKRFSVSAGWLHIMPQGSANPFNISTVILNGSQHKVGGITPKSFIDSVDLKKADAMAAEFESSKLS